MLGCLTRWWLLDHFHLWSDEFDSPLMDGKNVRVMLKLGTRSVRNNDLKITKEIEITYQDKATQTETEEEDTIEKLLKAITTLCIKVDSMDNEIQKLKTNEDNLKSKASQQHDYKNAELRRPEDGKNP
ncbi:hypothetical protein MTR67_043486 [Solanum verrucosum]|uniref:Uncharacterized protein n=1 Tax=Solanum verrucosum TaxID=315347 RepID=A0AAF0ZSQ5_SOLVR|nr:hypothetical protein MTR67_043486 [Solanum verrucosum]